MPKLICIQGNSLEINNLEIFGLKSAVYGMRLPLRSHHKADTIEDIKEDGEERFVKVFGILRDVKKIVTKKSGEIMAVFELEDYFGRISGIIFPRDFSRNMGNFIEGKVVYISGNIQTDYYIFSFLRVWHFLHERFDFEIQ